MRGAVLLLVFLLAGCSSPIQLVDDDKPPEFSTPPTESPEPSDTLTPKLPESSNAFQDFGVTEDSIDLPGGGWMQFQTGRGMHCTGDADLVAPNATGWVVCTVRLASDPTAVAQGVHDLGIGQDTTRLSLRMASEPVEWRVLVILANGTAMAPAPSNGVAFDSGWRLVDLSPFIEDPIVSVEVVDPCDVPDAQEQPPLGSRHGQATLKLDSVARHGRVSIAVDTTRSRPLDSQPGPTDVQTVGEHLYIGVWKVIGSPRPLEFGLHVDLEAPEVSEAPTPDGTCGVVTARETQEWVILLSIAGADGRVVDVMKTVTVDVAQSVQP